MTVSTDEPLYVVIVSAGEPVSVPTVSEGEPGVVTVSAREFFV